MKKFIVLYHAPAQALQQSAQSTPEQREASMQMWFDWKAKHDEAIVDFGAPLGNGSAVTQDLKSRLSEKEVCGFSVLQGQNQQEILQLFSDHPHLNWHPNATVEVHEVLEI
ncbi:hypothetical protein [Fulvivirga sedimenti]|uniref:YCII-related domain-containing protein n=1 Tax=Fulvivirga sedimenti TaxID=2879465 RepID=A0A9X1HWM5_9BACT|nr:hypothetical protein [Fulvivirga sedimenti]MCA6075529.1 hypothetical protein [Fulvivirga sedimenti]MCA6076706.1 hypothetical protein [Fulvivirga sedimenti]MCA6077834.1 hypothetical protein [Fulvivirga sedimenti]